MRQDLDARQAGAEHERFGRLLRGHRTRVHLTQEELADRAGVSERTLRNLEGGRVRHPHPATVRRLADALELIGEPRAQFQVAAQGVAVSAQATTVAPGLLPPSTRDFTGRVQEVAEILGLVEAGGDHEGMTAVIVSAVAGKPGVGKTALAVHAAHRLRCGGRFPDGQLYVNLEGAQAHPLDPGEALARLLRALGVDGPSIPDALEERAERYRSLLADRRVLVVLDNAAGEAQVRPLLPGSPSCGVLVTSRARLTGLEGARLVDLDVLPLGPAVELLGRVAGHDRVAAEPDVAVAIVGYCGRLPLAIRIAGARLAGRPHWSLAQLAERLADERWRLDELVIGDLEVRTSIALSYRGLHQDARWAFRRLGLLHAPDFPAWVVASLLDIPPSQGEALAEDLVAAQLLEVAGLDRVGQLRYRFHDLVRLFAGERAAAEDSADQQAASLARALGGWLGLAEQAEWHAPDRSSGLAHGIALRWHATEAGPGAVSARPLDWFEAEHAALVAAVHQAATSGLDELAWDLAGCLSGYLETRGWYDDWAGTHQQALVSARRSGDHRGEAYLLRRLGDLHMDQNRYDEASACYHEALAVSDKLGDERGGAYAVYSLGIVQQTRGRLDEAAASYSAAWSSFQRTADRRGQAQARYGMGAICQEQGLPARALEHFQASLAAFRDLGERRGATHLLRWIGSLHTVVGQPDKAEEVLGECLAVNRALGDRLGEAYALGTLGELHVGRRRFPEAESALDQSLQVFLELGNQSGQGWALRNLGLLRIAQRRPADARCHLAESVRLFGSLGMPLGEGRGLVAMGDAHLAEGDRQRARQAYERALDLFERLNVPEGSAARARLATITDH